MLDPNNDTLKCVQVTNGCCTLEGALNRHRPLNRCRHRLAIADPIRPIYNCVSLTKLEASYRQNAGIATNAYCYCVQGNIILVFSPLIDARHINTPRMNRYISSKPQAPVNSVRATILATPPAPPHRPVGRPEVVVV